MSKLFGIPVTSLALVLLAVLAVALGAIVAVGLRNRVFLRLGVRNVGRRRGRSILIVAGLMLGTAIVAAALATGDTMSQTIRSSATTALGSTDEVVARKGLEAALAAPTDAQPQVGYFTLADANRVVSAARATGLVNGAAPLVLESVAVLDVTSRQSEPRVVLFGAQADSLRGLGQIRGPSGPVTLADLRPGEVYLNAKAADTLAAKAGDTLRVMAGSRMATMRVRAIVGYAGTGTDEEALLAPLAPAQSLLGKPGQVKAVFLSNRDGVGQSDAVVEALTPTASALGLEVDNTKQDALDAADAAGATFMSFFTTFGSFSIAAGILLIFLIFVMLAAERRSELGIARAVGTRRGHLVQMFLFEGVAYDLVAAAVGALLGIALAYVLVLAMAAAFDTTDFHISYAVKPASIVLAYSLGVLLTLAVVGFSAWRVSRMNIVTAIRELPEPPAGKARRRRWIIGLLVVLLGAALAVAGASSKEQVVLGFGVSLVVLGLVPVARALGAPERAVHSGAGLALVLWFATPIPRWLFGELKVNFSIFVLGGLMIVIGATWTIMYNADVLLGALGATLGRVRAVAPVVRMAIAYPLRSIFRTGVTLAMFTLVVFTLVVGAITSGSFTNAINDLNSFGGGFDVRATSSAESPVTDLRAALGRAPGIDRASVRLIANESVLPIKARQLGAKSGEESYLVHGADQVFLANTTYGLATRARGYGSDAAVWRALRERQGLAVVDQFVVPRRANWGFGTLSKFKLAGFYLEDKSFRPVLVVVRDPETGRSRRLTVIGVLSDSAPQMMAGIWTSQATLASTFGDRVRPTVHLLALRPGVDANLMAKRVESAFLANGVQADSLRKLLDDAVAGSVITNRIVQGFMGLGLIVGVAALGVITARAVVERRQHIGVLRAIGFGSRMVQATLLLESSFIALTSIFVGTGLGLLVSYQVVHDSQRQPSWRNLSFDVPWLNLGLIFVVVYAVALLTTWAPALRASRVYPAQALRYQ